MSVTIGVLSIQGNVHENILSARAALVELGIDGEAVAVKTPDEISRIDGLIIPGGESTTIGQLSVANGSLSTLEQKIQGGMPVLGICAGMIMLSKSARDKVVGKVDQPLLDILDIKLERNSFGRQKESFESVIDISPIGIPKFNGVFIRAPSVSEVGSGVEILSKFGDRIVAVKKGNVVGTAFHPELTRDVSLHKYFVSLVVSQSKN